MKSTLHALAFEFLHDIALQNDTNKRDLIGVNPQAILEIRELTEKMRNKIKIDQTYLVQFSLDLNLLNVFKRVFKPKMPFQDQFGAEMLIGVLFNQSGKAVKQKTPLAQGFLFKNR